MVAAVTADAANLVCVATIDVISVGSFVDDIAVVEIVDETNSIGVGCLFLGDCSVSSIFGMLA